ncbi:MAG: cytochrome c oxidase subunit II [Solirubrobacteraceae bacterium]
MLAHAPSSLGADGDGSGILQDEITFQLIAGGAVWLLVLGILVAIVLRQRRRRSAGPPQPEDQVGHRWIWIGGVVLPLIVLTAVLGWSAHSFSAFAGGGDRPVLTVEVIAHRWWWEVRYLGEFEDAVTANELVLPVGQPLELKLRTDDVIHAFWVPELDRKIDVIPGEEHSLHLVADKPGTYRGECVEFCGLQHARMAFRVTAVAPDQFADWLARETGKAEEPDTAAERRGKQVFLSSTCAACHTIRGAGAAGQVGPDLTHLATRASIAAETLPNTRGGLSGWISDPQGIKRGVHMPRSQLPGDQLQDLVTYLESLR